MIQAKRWDGKKAPRKILIIRFQALGDTIITLPYISSLKSQFPDSELHFLTRQEVSDVPARVRLFSRIFALRGGRNPKLQLAHALLMLPVLWLQRYDAILDLQNNRVTKIIRRILNPPSWTEFDLYSQSSAGERTRKTIEALWTWKILPQFNFPIGPGASQGVELLNAGGFRSGNELIILNPAGYCPSRSWPLKNYVDFARQWRKTVSASAQFVLLLLPAHKTKALFIKRELGDCCIDLTGRANQVQAFDIISKAALMLSEDSGLMHMAWIQRVPTVALFSSSRKDWSGPQGEWSLCLDSSDLDCGPCGLEVCKWHDNRCLTRYSAAYVLEKAERLRVMNL